MAVWKAEERLPSRMALTIRESSKATCATGEERSNTQMDQSMKAISKTTRYKASGR